MSVIDKTAQVHTPLLGTDNVIDLTASGSVAFTQSNSTVLLDNAAGLTLTLPKPVAGLTYQIVVLTTVTSGSYKIVTDSASTFLLGEMDIPVAAGTAKNPFFADGTTTRSINLNGTTTGGLKGGVITLTAVNSTTWLVNGTAQGSGTVVTPYATS